MRKRVKFMALALATVLGATSLAGCAGQPKKALVKKYSYVYSTDPDTLDYITSSRSTTSDVTGNLVDGLMENDRFGNFVPSLAKDWTVSADGKTYTYTLRDGIKWFTADGEEYADIKAEDFVTGIKHAVEKKAGLLYLIQDSIEGLSDFVSGKNTDFSKVGVKALDDKTIQYKLVQPEPFWNTKLTTGVLFPVNEKFLKSKGKDFGKPQPDGILYSGPYLLSAMTAKSAIEFKKNPKYWDAEKVSIEHVKLTYFDGSDLDSLIRGFQEGNYTVCAVNASAPSFEKAKKEHADELVRTDLQSTTFYGYFNLNRSNYESTAKTTEKQKEDTRKALLNKNFRQAINFALDRTKYNAQTAGVEAASIKTRNMIIPPDFVQVNGKNFNVTVEKELEAIGEEWKGVKLEDGQDGMFNAERAKKAFAKAKEELTAEGVSFPISIDLPVFEAQKPSVDQASSFKQTVESVLGKENVVIELQKMNKDKYYKATFFASTPEQNNYDISTASGWSPDYVDPSSYLDIFSLDSGAQLHTLGLLPTAEAKGDAKYAELAKKVGLDEFTKIVNEAAKITNNNEERFSIYAKAQAWLVDNSLSIVYSGLGGALRLGKEVPYTAAYGRIGQKGSGTYKLMQVQEQTVKTAEHKKAKEQWKKEKEESHKKAAEEFEKAYC